jgi:hypothetical protein
MDNLIHLYVYIHARTIDGALNGIVADLSFMGQLLIMNFKFLICFLLYLSFKRHTSIFC